MDCSHVCHRAHRRMKFGEQRRAIVLPPHRVQTSEHVQVTRVRLTTYQAPPSFRCKYPSHAHPRSIRDLRIVGGSFHHKFLPLETCWRTSNRLYNLRAIMRVVELRFCPPLGNHQTVHPLGPQAEFSLSLVSRCLVGAASSTCVSGTEVGQFPDRKYSA